MLCERLQKKEEGRLFFNRPSFFHLTKKKSLYIIRSPFCFGFLSLTLKRGAAACLSPFFIHALKTHAELSELITRRRVARPLIFHCVGDLARIKKSVDAFLFNVADAVERIRG